MTMSNNTDINTDTAESFRPAISLVATAKKRGTVLDLAQQAEAHGFAGIACPSLGAAMGFCTSLAHVTKTIKFWTSIQPIYYRSMTDTEPETESRI